MKSINKLFFRILNNFIDNKFGLRIQPSSNSRLKSSRNLALKVFMINHLIDVGANSGQYAKSLRSAGYKNYIYSFEPTYIYSELSKNAISDDRWQAYNYGIGDKSEKVIMQIASNESQSSSILLPKDILKQNFGITFNQSEYVQIQPLSYFISENKLENIYLKIDTQGNEMNVLRGLGTEIDKISVVEFESAIIPLYEGESNHYQLADFLISKRFIPTQIVITHWDKDKQTVSLDSIFVRKDT
jgi:FkbM family methyltransferase